MLFLRFRIVTQSSFNRQLPTAHRQPATVNRQPSTATAQLQVLQVL